MQSKEPIPQVVAKSSVKSGVEQNANKKSAKQTKNFRKEKSKNEMLVSPSQKTAIIEKKETISSEVSLFVNPLITSASKTIMQAYINKSPKIKYLHPNHQS